MPCIITIHDQGYESEIHYHGMTKRETIAMHLYAAEIASGRVAAQMVSAPGSVRRADQLLAALEATKGE